MGWYLPGVHHLHTGHSKPNRKRIIMLRFSDRQKTAMKTEGMIAGWCPNHGVSMPRNNGWRDIMLISQMRGSGSPSEGKEDVTYRHRQIGRIQIWGGIVALSVILITSIFVPEIWMLFLIATLALGFAVLFFSTLTVEVRTSKVCIAFGPLPLIRKRVPLEMIREYQTVQTPWYYGWGLRYIKGGMLYNVSGFAGVELMLTTGKRIRIGTDDPAGLYAAIAAAVGSSSSP